MNDEVLRVRTFFSNHFLKKKYAPNNKIKGVIFELGLNILIYIYKAAKLEQKIGIVNLHSTE